MMPGIAQQEFSWKCSIASLTCCVPQTISPQSVPHYCVLILIRYDRARHRVDTTAFRSGPQEQRGKKRSRRRQEKVSAAQEEQSGQQYHPVLCELCDTEMGVQSAEEDVVIFYHVVPSGA